MNQMKNWNNLIDDADDFQEEDGVGIGEGESSWSCDFHVWIYELQNLKMPDVDFEM